MHLEWYIYLSYISFNKCNSFIGHGSSQHSNCCAVESDQQYVHTLAAVWAWGTGYRNNSCRNLASGKEGHRGGEKVESRKGRKEEGKGKNWNKAKGTRRIASG